jgi:hypothetical protein
MDYTVVFDRSVATAGYRTWWFPALGAVMTAGCGLFVLQQVRKNSPRQLATVFLALMTMLIALWTVDAFVTTFGQYYGLKSAIADGRAAVVVGVVTDFMPHHMGGRGPEKFCVRDTCFAYSDSVVTGGFNTTQANGGPIRDGLPVRVTYVGGRIVRLEIGRR